MVSRGQILLAPATFWVMIVIKTGLMRMILSRLRKKGKHCQSVLLVGSGKKLEDFISLLESHPVWGFKIEGVISDDPTLHSGSMVKHYPVVGTLSQTLEYVHQHPVDEVVDFNVQVAAAAPVQSVNNKVGNVVLDAADVGAAATSHAHDASAITGGTIAVARGGTGLASPGTAGSSSS